MDGADIELESQHKKAMSLEIKKENRILSLYRKTPKEKKSYFDVLGFGITS